jgi:DNA invertase Pin-like site-specific DNA recombinase
MDHWWEIGLPDAQAPVLVKAVAYYRHSAQDRQENSIPIQQDQVRAWAKQHGIEIIHEFYDIGPSELAPQERSAFTEMLEEWIKPRFDFELVLCLEASRLGRFPVSDRWAELVEMIDQFKKQLVFTSMVKQ